MRVPYLRDLGSRLVGHGGQASGEGSVGGDIFTVLAHVYEGAKQVRGEEAAEDLRWGDEKGGEQEVRRGKAKSLVGGGEGK
jgi:hypothetical protein